MRSLKTLLAATVGLLAVAAVAMPTYGPIVLKQYNLKKDGTVAKATCALCHASKTEFKKYNPYGTDLKAALDKAKTKQLTPEILKSVEGLDSDKDGVKNGDELKNDKLPGDPKSK